MPKSIFETDSEKITSEYNVAEDWQGIMDFCDKLKATPNGSKEALKCIMKRVNHPIPHVSMQALTLLAACADNCGKPFHLEICSREWTNDAKAVILRSHGKVSSKLREIIQKWAETFKDDAQLNLMVHFYKKLKADGFSFDSAAVASGATPQATPQVKDELSFKEDIDLAIAMSLQDENQGNQAPSTSLYPTVMASAQSSAVVEEREVCQVRALYDFEAAEDNEMTFKSGEIFSVLDNSDENWWKGRNSKGVGLFPANFVTTDLTEKSPEKKVHFSLPETNTVPHEPAVRQKVSINEEQLDLALSMLKNASPNEIDDEEETICTMEDQADDMGNLIEKKILACEERRENLGDVNERFLKALDMYQQLMKEPAAPPPMPPSYQANSSPQHSLQYQQQMYISGHPHHQPQFNAAFARNYPSQPQVAGHQLDMENTYSSQGPSGIMRQQQQHLTQQALMQSPSFTSQPVSLPAPSSIQPLSRQPASLPMQHTQQQQLLPHQQMTIAQVSASGAPASLQHPSQSNYEISQVNYNQQQFTPGQLTGTDNGQFTPQQTEYMNYGYNIPHTTSYQQTSVYQ